MDHHPPATATSHQRTGRLACAPLLVGCLAGWAGAAEDPPLLSGAIAVDAGATFNERTRDDHGAIDSDWQLAEGRLFIRPHVALRLGVGIGLVREGYRGDGADQGGLPDDVQQAWVRLPLAVMFHPHWGLTMQGSFGSGGDDAASFADGRQWQVQGGPLYVRDENLIIALMVNVSSRIEDHPTIFPFPSLYWRFNEDWQLTVVDEVDNLSRLTYAVNEAVDVGIRLDVRFREAALGADRVLSDDHVATAVQATWNLGGRVGDPAHGDPRLTITPFAGMLLVRRLAIRERGGDEQWSAITRPAPLVGLDLRGRF